MDHIRSDLLKRLNRRSEVQIDPLYARWYGTYMGVIMHPLPVKTLRFRNNKAVTFFEQSFKRDADKVILEAALMDLVRRAVISGGKAAELLGVDRWQLPELLEKHNVDTVEYSKTIVNVEARTLRRALKAA